MPAVTGKVCGWLMGIVERCRLSAFMNWLTLTHTQRWRHAHHTVGYGPLYQGRFKSFPIQRDEHLLSVCRYVERNPLRAGIVERAEDWRWSSLWHRLNPGQKLGLEKVFYAFAIIVLRWISRKEMRGFFQK
jgi:hypothetical protein